MCWSVNFQQVVCRLKLDCMTYNKMHLLHRCLGFIPANEIQIADIYFANLVDTNYADVFRSTLSGLSRMMRPRPKKLIVPEFLRETTSAVAFKQTLLPTSLMLDVVSSYSRIKCLRLDSVVNATDGMMCAIVKHCNFLTRISLRCCIQLTDKTLECIESFAALSLVKIDVSGCFQVSERGFNSLISKCQNLQELDASQCYNLSQAFLVQVARSCKQLARFCFTEFHGEIATSTLEALIHSCVKLHTININRHNYKANKFNNTILFEVWKRDIVKELHFTNMNFNGNNSSNNNNKNDDSGISVLPYFPIPELEIFHLLYAPYNDGIVNYIALGSQLRDIQIKFVTNKLQYFSFISIIGCYCAKLKILKMEYVGNEESTNKDFVAIEEGITTLSQSCVYLSELTIALWTGSFNYISDHILIRLFRQCPYLISLNLPKHIVGHEFLQELHHLRSSSLTSFTYHPDKLTIQQGLGEISTIHGQTSDKYKLYSDAVHLRGFSQLRELTLIKYVANTMKEITICSKLLNKLTIYSPYLCMNADDIIAIANNCPRLTYLDVQSCKDDENTGYHLAYLIGKCVTLQHLYIDGTNMKNIDLLLKEVTYYSRFMTKLAIYSGKYISSPTLIVSLAKYCKLLTSLTISQQAVNIAEDTVIKAKAANPNLNYVLISSAY